MKTLSWPAYSIQSGQAALINFGSSRIRVKVKITVVCKADIRKLILSHNERLKHCKVSQNCFFL